MAGIKVTACAVEDKSILCYQHPTCTDFDIVRDGIVYRIIPGWPKYRIGEDGSGWSRKISRVKGMYQWHYWKALTPAMHTGGYLQFHFYDDYHRKPMFVHRLVLETFVGPCPDGMEGRHYPDRDRTNCRIENLSWSTRPDNHADKIEHGTLLQGSGVGNSKLTEADIPIILGLSKAGWLQRQIAEKFGVEQTNIGFILRGKTWKHVPRP